MSSISYIPRPDADFNEWQEQFMSYLAANLARFGLQSADIAELNNLKMDWFIKYSVTTDPAQRTPPAVLAKTEQRKVYEKALRAFAIEHLIHNSKLTNADRLSLGLTVPKDTRTPVPVPETSPSFRVLMPEQRRLVIEFYDETAEKRAKPPGVHGAEIRHAILAAPPEHLDELTHSAFDTRSPFTLDYDESDRGKTVYLCLRWENTRGEKGPWSPLASAIIP
jgi:hypothetical protein